MPRCLHYHNGRFREYSSIVDDYVSDPLTLRDVLTSQEHGDTYEERADRADRARANYCSIRDAGERCVWGAVLVRRGGTLVPEPLEEWV